MIFHIVFCHYYDDMLQCSYALFKFTNTKKHNFQNNESHGCVSRKIRLNTNRF